MRLNVSVRGLWIGVGSGASLDAGVGLGEVEVPAVLLEPHATSRREAATSTAAPTLGAYIAEEYGPMVPGRTSPGPRKHMKVWLCHTAA